MSIGMHKNGYVQYMHTFINDKKTKKEDKMLKSKENIMNSEEFNHFNISLLINIFIIE